MTDGFPIRNRSENRLWTLLGIVELTYHPALAVTLLATVHVLVSPVPVVTFDPVSIALAGESRGVPVTTFFAGVVLVDLASDIVGVYAHGRDERRRAEAEAKRGVEGATGEAGGGGESGGGDGE